MRALISCVLALLMITPGLAGAEPYVAIVGNDKDANEFYISPNNMQFVYNQELLSVPVCDGTFPAAYDVYGHIPYGPGCEQFRSRTPIIQPEVCDINGYTEGVNYFSDYGQPNAVTRMGDSGWYEWYIRLPKQPGGQISLVLQCGVLIPNAFTIFQYDAVTICAAETGARVGNDMCVRAEVEPGQNPLIIGALPRITAIAYPGPYNDFPPFHLTAFRNSGRYFFSGKMMNEEGMQLLDGKDAGTRIMLKACMDETLIAKLPVTGQVNAADEQEFDLEAGDIIYVRLDIPRQNTVDIYCHEQSLKLMGMGGPTW